MKATGATAALALASVVPAGVAYAAAIGLGLHRHGTPWAVSVGATLVVFLPPVMAATAATHRARAFFAATLAWTLAGLAVLPVYFPGERRDAVSAGLSLLMGSAGWEDFAERVADSLPEEPELAAPELAQAVEVVPAPLPPARDLLDHEIVLPYEGPGERQATPLEFRHDGLDRMVLFALNT
ncbi:MAG: hypothetical protein KC656_25075, partial [Myxococcales bacterium]|nr:hypothetical protein [Myxococcales bacterium]